MTLLSEAQLEALERPDLVGMLYPGMQTSLHTQATSNKKYFAYATILSVYVYDIRTRALVNVISIGNESIATISFSKQYPERLAISYQSCMHIVDVCKNELIAKIPVKEAVVSIAWVKNDTKLICFTQHFSSYNVYDPETGESLGGRSGAFENIRVVACSSSSSEFIIGGNHRGTITRIIPPDEVQSLSFSNRGPVVASHLDPNCETNCLVVWSRGAWALIDSITMQVMNDVSGLSFEFGAAIWSSLIPGQFFTGDASVGVLRVWNAGSDTQLDSFKLHSSGITSLLDLQENRLLIGFTDGMVAVYDIENRHFIFENPASHSNTVFSAKFMPLGSDHFLTAGGEGALCAWSASGVKQIYRITQTSSLGGLYSMDISPGGGLAACGYAQGNVALFSLETKALVSTIELCHSRIISVSFNPHVPEELLCVSDGGYAVVFDIVKKEKLWQSPTNLCCLVGAFSPHDGDTFAIGCKDGKLTIWKKKELFTSTREGDDDIYFIAWSPLKPNVLATSDDGGNVKVWHLEEEPTSYVVGQHIGKARPLVFHPTFESLLISGGTDREIMIHNIDSHWVMCSFTAHAAAIYALAASPLNPHLLISAGSDSSIKFWSMDRLFTHTAFENIMQRKFEWLRPLEGFSQLLKLARRISKKPGETIVFDRHDIPHINDVVRLASKAVEKATDQSMPGRVIQMAIKSKDRMMKAAKLELYMGNLKHYCELLFAMGEFDQAVAAAPGVSHKFWSQLMKKRAKLFDRPTDKANCLLVNGQAEKAIDVLLESDHTEKAFLIAAAVKSGCFQTAVKKVPEKKKSFEHPYIDRTFQDPRLYLEYRAASERAHFYLSEGKIYMAAIAFLSIGDVISAQRLLIRHGQIFAAFIIDSITQAKDRKTQEKFAMLGIQSNSTSGVSECDISLKKRLVLAIKFETEDERRDYYLSIGLEEPEKYRKDSEITKDPAERIHLLMLAGERRMAIHLYADFMQVNLKRNFAAARDLTKIMELANLENLDVSLVGEVVCMSLYFAGYEALWKGYRCIYAKIPERMSDIVDSLALLWIKQYADELTNAMIIMGTPRNHTKTNSAGMRFLNSQKLGVPYNPATMYGKQYYLEDGATTLTMEEALTWFEVTPFSPLTLGTRHYVI